MVSRQDTKNDKMGSNLGVEFVGFRCGGRIGGVVAVVVVAVVVVVNSMHPCFHDSILLRGGFSFGN